MLAPLICTLFNKLAAGALVPAQFSLFKRTYRCFFFDDHLPYWEFAAMIVSTIPMTPGVCKGTSWPTYSLLH